ncbi:Bifunctional D-cysteine desulfhydrase/1-aminocyclopropane-1-carboxylate deaminase, mitochondrial [Seminavis robusta]|uniref:Bifunctional D-cysteine desulfhydrase/1-aminocyclopropane-1-carboxylate deaminase, mitochondrial n=1 Tax=Seminavis robusta TaxID=568900 RepID=A0A9N8D4V0_9STRA|nr:Bifunctional D-cysteine desulfhydrase/1-aminocyclopropane-1-carboxylate deaminase, mitochondrial [Seminavis robusta]|eukprot:Sro5_g004170.1 Bifunctional D-cysteine desulfhydrase/1-aminocyclopropane-1-carboxylate deaminase, mitochondrial (427) ;mRNA; r:75064-76344
MSSTRAMATRDAVLQRIVPFELPSWAAGYFTKPPVHGRIPLGNLPTPLHPIHAPHHGSTSNTSSILQQFHDRGISLYTKRDDMSGGVELGGNKIRKLEFLLADALRADATQVVTIGGEQSNHCRATAAAARMIGLEPHLILRTRRVSDTSEDFGMTGNILFDRMVGSTIYTCTPGEYGRLGSVALVQRLCKHLAASEDSRPYAIPVGGSNGLGSFGYIQAVDELLSQWKQSEQSSLDHIVFACGSGGTAAGIVLGIALAFRQEQATSPPTIHAVGVCDSPDYFYKFVAGIADEMGFCPPNDNVTTEEFMRQHMIVHQGKGLGYAVSTEEELDFVSQFALETGMSLDPVYSGKALYTFVKHVVENSDNDKSFQPGTNVLFWHTGGALGLYDKGDDLLKRLQQQSPVLRLDVYGKDLENSVDISTTEE